MAGCGGSHCGFKPCRCGGSFTDLSGMQIDQTLVRSLVPCVDAIRDIYTCFGARAYEVVLVHTKWTGGERGVGQEEVVSEEKILPTPKVSSLAELDTVLEAIGEQEMGSLRISEISGRFTEAFLTGRRDGRPIPDDENFYWEVRFLGVDGSVTRRRFSPDSAPNYEPLKFQWVIVLTRTVQDRTDDGQVRD